MIEQLLVIAAISFLTSIVSGTLGIGGAVLLIPMYLYVPPLFGVELTVAEITGMTSVQVFFAAAMSAFTHHKKGGFNKRLALLIGVPMVSAALIGAIFSKSVSGDTLTTIFGLMAAAGGALLLLQRKYEEPTEFTVHPGKSVLIGTSVGFFGGMVGAPGGFLVQPLLMIFMRIPTRITIGTTLGVVMLSALSASIGKAITGQVPYVISIAAAVAAIPGAKIGSELSHKLHVKQLKLLLGLLILGVGLQMILRGIL
jgi:uncharacterized protein